MQSFEAIAISELVTVTGGEDGGIFANGAGPNRMSAEGEVSVDTPVGVKVKGQGKYQESSSDFATCLRTSSEKDRPKCFDLIKKD